MAKKEQKRATADITEIYEDLMEYPTTSGEIKPEAWEMLTDAQKLVYLAKLKIKEVKERNQDV